MPTRILRLYVWRDMEEGHVLEFMSEVGKGEKATRISGERGGVISSIVTEWDKCDMYLKKCVSSA